MTKNMQLTLLKSKIHRATVTGASLDYEGSLTVSVDLAELVGLIPYEKILVSNLNNGERFETYAIFGEARRGIIELNGATAHLGKIADASVCSAGSPGPRSTASAAISGATPSRALAFPRGRSSEPSLNSITKPSLINQRKSDASESLRGSASSVATSPINFSKSCLRLITAVPASASRIAFTDGDTPACS